MVKKRIGQQVALYAVVGIAGSAVIGHGSSASKPDAGSEQASREAADGTGTGSEERAHIGIIFTEAGLGGNSFNDLALGDIKKAAADCGITYDEVEPKSVSDEETIQDEMATSGDYGLIICMGAEQVDALTNVASTYPEQRFALLDTTSDLPNVASYFYRKQEGVSPADTLVTPAKQEKTDDKLKDGKTIGFIGGVDNPPINRLAMGCKAGAEYIEPGVKVLIDYAGGFNDPATAETVANIFVEKGADVIFHITGTSGMGMFQAAKEKGFAAIGVNLNQNSVAPDYIMASMLKKLDSCARHAIASIIEDTYTGESQTLGLNDGGVDVTVEGSNIRASDDTLTRPDELKQKVISREIQTPSEFN